MKKIIIVRNTDETQIYAAADAFAKNSISVIICDKAETGLVLEQNETDAVFSFRFDEDISALCSANSIPCVFWILEYPAPEVFSLKFFDENNLIVIPDRELYEIFYGIGHPCIYYAKDNGGFIKHAGDKEKAKLIFDRIMLRLENDEKKYLHGLLRAQEVCPEKNILFKALGDDLIIKMYTFAGLPDEDIMIKKRYVISECILRPVTVHY